MFHGNLEFSMKLTRQRLLFFLGTLLFCATGVLGQAISPSVLEQIAPKYPAAALAVRASGTVQIVAEIDSLGKVLSVKAFTGHPLLRRMAEITVEKWRFSAVPGNHFISISISVRPGDQDQDVVIIRGPYTVILIGQRSRIMAN